MEEAKLRELSIRLIVACEKGDQETVLRLLEHEQKDRFIHRVDTETDENALFKAARKGHLKIGQLLLDHGINVESLNDDLSTPLIVASQYGHTSIVRLLLESGKCLTDRYGVSLTGRSALMIASENGHTETVEVLLKYGANVQTQTSSDEWTALFFACKNGHITIVRLLLEYKANICIKTKKNQQLSALIVASQNGRCETVNVLIECGANVNVEGVMEPTKTGRIVTPLMVASDKEMVELLLKHGAKINKQVSEEGWTALMFASYRRQTETATFLLELGADVDIQGYEKPHSESCEKSTVTALMIASRLGYSEIVQLLIEHKTAINMQNNNGWTALMFASDNRQTKTITLLLEHGADTGIQGKKRSHVHGYEETTLTALMHASRRGYTEIAKLLLDYKAEINMQNNKGWTALMFASNKGYIETATLLLERGADVEIQRKESSLGYKEINKLTALMIASRHGYTEIVELLLKYKAAIDVQNNEGWTALMFASNRGQSGYSLLEPRVDVYYQRSEISSSYPGITPTLQGSALGRSIHSCTTKVVQLLLEHKAAINMQSNEGWTALMFASDKGHTETALLLLKHGAEVDLQGFKMAKEIDTGRECIFKGGYMTALMIASQNGNKGIVELLLIHGVKVNVQAKDIGWTALMFASDYGHTEIAKLLLKHGADVDVLGVGSGQEFTALMIASKHGFAKIARIMLESGANINFQNSQGMSALMIAIESELYSLSELLLKHKADVNLQNNEGISALMIASQRGDFNTVLLLLEYGADIKMTDKCGMSAASFTKEKETFELFQILEQEQHLQPSSQPYFYHQINLGIYIYMYNYMHACSSYLSAYI